MPARALARAEGVLGKLGEAPIECGYSSETECENAVGKGGVCFVDPEYAMNVKREPKPARSLFVVIDAKKRSSEADNLQLPAAF